MKFQCKKCMHLFEHEGLKKEYTDPVYGACFKYMALCPVCSEESNEYRAPKIKSRASSDGPSCGRSHGGGCPCCN